jgi:hypothetical protein
MSSFSDWYKACPYGQWTCANGRQVLFNRSYWPILERTGEDGPVIAANPDERIDWIKQDYFFDDGNSPWRRGRFGNTKAAKKTLERINAVLMEWEVGELGPPPLRVTTTDDNRLRFVDMSNWDNEPIPPRVNPWVRLLKLPPFTSCDV